MHVVKSSKLNIELLFPLIFFGREIKDKFCGRTTLKFCIKRYIY